MRRVNYLIIAFASLLGCKQQPLSVRPEGQYYTITSEIGGDEKVEQFLSPFRDSLYQAMNQPLAYSAAQMLRPVCGSTPQKEQVALVNFIADAWFNASTKQFRRELGIEPDFFVTSCGSVRASLPEGTITLGNIYELMPFDNHFVVAELDNAKLRLLLEHIAAADNYPVANLTMDVIDNRPHDVLIGGKPIDPDREYRVAISSYHATGGDNMLFFRDVKKIYNSDLLFRDALIQEVKNIHTAGDTIKADYEPRVKK